MINTPSGDIVLDCQINTHNGWVAGVDFLQSSNEERAVSAMAPLKQNINNLYIELDHPSDALTSSTANGLSIQVTDTFKLCKDCALGKAKQRAVSK